MPPCIPAPLPSSAPPTIPKRYVPYAVFQEGAALGPVSFDITPDI
ncbi:hypothetical protein L541_1316, partial [Bordetella hinzii CA90 BAL1384]